MQLSKNVIGFVPTTHLSDKKVIGATVGTLEARESPNGTPVCLKMGTVGGEVPPWHQDEAYAPPEVSYGQGGGFGVVNSWMPLQDVSVESGCMQFVPWVDGRQPEVLPHHHINHDPRIHGLELDDLGPTKRAVACPLPAGGATFHVMRTLHYSGPNLTSEPRRAFILKFAVPGAAAPTENPPERPWQRAHTTNIAQEKRLAAAERGILVGAARAVLSTAASKPKL